jgi:hypothetical protein
MPLKIRIGNNIATLLPPSGDLLSFFILGGLYSVRPDHRGRDGSWIYNYPCPECLSPLKL